MHFVLHPHHPPDFVGHSLQACWLLVEQLLAVLVQVFAVDVGVWAELLSWPLLKRRLLVVDLVVAVVLVKHQDFGEVVWGLPEGCRRLHWRTRRQNARYS